MRETNLATAVPTSQNEREAEYLVKTYDEQLLRYEKNLLRLVSVSNRLKFPEATETTNMKAEAPSYPDGYIGIFAKMRDVLMRFNGDFETNLDRIETMI